MHRALQNGCGRSAERDRAEHECDREKDNAGELTLPDMAIEII